MGARKVLIVDDEPEVLESTALLVESLGYEAIRLSDPSQILDVVEREDPGLLLQDLRMAGLNVSGLVAALRSNPATSHVPIVFFSAGGDLPATAARFDVWGYLPKPFSREELSRLLERTVGPTSGRPHPATTPKVLRREVRTVFHEYWNLIAALTNYIEILDRSPDPESETEKAMRGLDATILQLEAKTDRLFSYLMSLIETLETLEPMEEAGPNVP